MTATGPSGTASPPPSGPSWTDLGPRVLSAAVIIAVIATGLYFGGYVFAGLAAVVFARHLSRVGADGDAEAAGAVRHGADRAACRRGAGLSAARPARGGRRSSSWPSSFRCSAAGRWSPWRAGGLLFFGAVLIAVLAMRGDGTPAASSPAGISASSSRSTIPAPTSSAGCIGGPKLAPMISPAKTWSGAIGGWVLGTVAGTDLLGGLHARRPGGIGLVFSAAARGGGADRAISPKAPSSACSASRIRATSSPAMAASWTGSTA